MTKAGSRTYVRIVPRASALTKTRLAALYEADGFGGEKTMRAKVIRELIDEIRALREERDLIEARTVNGSARGELGRRSLERPS